MMKRCGFLLLPPETLRPITHIPSVIVIRLFRNTL
jgi:hypothetical protein